MARKTIAEHAVDVLKETDNWGVMYGDSYLIHKIADRAGMKRPKHPLILWQRVLAALERRPNLFEKHYTRMDGRLYRVFTLREDV